jgi:hypothetical protein
MRLKQQPPDNNLNGGGASLPQNTPMQTRNKYAIQKASPFATKQLGSKLQKVIQDHEREKDEHRQTFKDGLIDGLLIGILAGLILAGALIKYL